MSLRILHAYEPRVGGILRFVADLAESQAREGHEVHVLAPAGTWLSGFVDGHLAVHQWSLDRRRPWSFVTGRRQLGNILRNHEIEVVHLHSFFAGLIGRARRLPVPAIVYQPNAWAFRFQVPFGAIARACERRGARNCDVIAAVSRDEAIEGEQAGLSARMVRTGTAVDLERFHPVDGHERSAVTDRLGIGDRPLAVCLGRICEQKGQDRLVISWAAHNMREIDLVLIGEGSENFVDRVKKNVGGMNVRFVGQQRDVRPWLWAADVIVQPSRWEGLSIVVGEALACGAPVVATAATGMSEAILDHGPPAGAVVDIDDMDALVAEVRRRTKDPQLRKAESRAARERAEKLFDPKTMHARVLDLYLSVLNDKRSRRSRSAAPTPPR